MLNVNNRVSAHIQWRIQSIACWWRLEKPGNCRYIVLLSYSNLTVCSKATAHQKQNNYIHLVVENVFGFIETSDVPLTTRQLHILLDKTKLDNALNAAYAGDPWPNLISKRDHACTGLLQCTNHATLYTSNVWVGKKHLIYMNVHSVLVNPLLSPIKSGVQ